MSYDLILASGSHIRARLLRNVGLNIDVQLPRIDEDSIRCAMKHEGASPRDIADALAEHKARKVASKGYSGFVLGCDQILTIEGRILVKPATPEDAIAHLRLLSGESHQLLSAAVLYNDGAPVWRHVGVVRLRMRELSEVFIQDYVARNWDSIRDSVGAYKLEEEGARLFSSIEGDHFNVLGLPLLNVLSFLHSKGILST